MRGGAFKGYNFCQGLVRKIGVCFLVIFLNVSPGGGMVDALVSGTNVSNDVQVRVLFWAQNFFLKSNR